MSTILPVLGIDPGARWTAGCLVYGGQPMHGWTLGPTSPSGELAPAAIDDLNDLDAAGRYLDAVVEAATDSYELARRMWGSCSVAIEGVRVPHGGGRGRVGLKDWINPRTVALTLRATFPHAVIVPPSANGRAPRESYPPELRRRRPETWGPCQARRGERDHERAAYDVALAGLRLIEAREAAA